MEVEYTLKMESPLQGNNLELMENIVENNNTEKEAEVQEEKPTRLIGIIAVVLFFLFDGLSICSWYMWIVFAILALLTVGGIYKWGQAFFGAVLLIWGSSLFGGEPSSSNDSYYETSSYETTSSSSKSDVKQSDSERKYIEQEIAEIESLYAQYQNADRQGLETDAKRLSDLAFNKYQALNNRNLTRAQRNRLSKLFAL